VVLWKLIEPIVENVNWIKQEQEKQSSKITAKQINHYIYDQTAEYLDLIGEFCKACSNLARDTDEHGQARLSPFEPIFQQIW